MSLDEFLYDMATPTGFYYSIIMNIVEDDKVARALVSELSLYYLERREETTKKINEKNFKYWFIRTVINQVKSKSSPFYKNYVKIYSDVDISKYSELLEDVSDDDIEHKIIKERKHKWLESIIEGKSDVKMTWFENQMFKLYYIEGKTYRAIQDEWGVNFLTVFNTVKELKEKIKKKV